MTGQLRKVSTNILAGPGLRRPVSGFGCGWALVHGLASAHLGVDLLDVLALGEGALVGAQLQQAGTEGGGQEEATATKRRGGNQKSGQQTLAACRVMPSD